LYKAGIILDPPDFEMILLSPELLCRNMELNTFRSYLTDYQELIDGEEREDLSPIVGYSVRQLAMLFGVTYWLSGVLSPGEGEVQTANRKLMKLMGAVTGVLLWSVYAIGLVAHSRGIFNGALAVGLHTFFWHFNVIFVSPWALACLVRNNNREALRENYFVRSTLRYEQTKVQGDIVYGHEVLNELCNVLWVVSDDSTIPLQFRR
jgi:hypothetical protein